MLQKIPKDQIPEELKAEVRQTLVAGSPEGQQMQVLVTEVNDSGIVIDANHPLAGHDLEFDIELVEVK